MREAALLLGRLDARKRQLGTVAAKAIQSGESATGCATTILWQLIYASTTLGSLGVLLLQVLPDILRGNYEDSIPIGIALAGPSLAMTVGLLVVTVRMRRNLALLRAQFLAIPPLAPGEPAMCHVCGGPLGAPPGAGVARCPFCHTDNIVAPSALGRAVQKSDWLLSQHERELQARWTHARLFPWRTAAVAALVFLVSMPVSCAGCSMAEPFALRMTDPQQSREAAVSKLATLVAVNSSYVVWTAYDGIHMMRKSGGKVRELASPAAAEYGDVLWEEALAVDESHAYWLQRSGRLMRASFAERRATVLAEPDGLEDPSPWLGAVAVDSTHVYWVKGVAVRRMPKEGGQASVLARADKGGCRLALGLDLVFFANDQQEILAMPKQGGEARRVAQGEFLCHLQKTSTFAADDSGLYWYDGQVIHQVRAGEESVRDLARTNGVVGGLALHGDYVYWVTQKETMPRGSTTRYGWVQRVRKDGGEPEVMAKGAKDTVSVAVDDTAVYWTEKLRGRLMVLPR